jgi:hypothetical protein
MPPGGEADGMATAQAAVTEERADVPGFWRLAAGILFDRRLLVPALLVGLFLTISNIAVIFAAPHPGIRPGPAFAAAAFVRVAGVLASIVALARIMARSPRRPWMPDGAFWLSVLLFVVTVALAGALALAFGRPPLPPLAALASAATLGVIQAPFAAWLAAIMVARPLAWDPRPWFTRFRAWLLPVIVGELVLAPFAVAHESLDLLLIKGAGRWFWPVVLVDGPLSLVMVLGGLTLYVAAYASIARR